MWCGKHNDDILPIIAIFDIFNHPDQNMERFDTHSDSESDIDTIESETGEVIIEMCKDKEHISERFTYVLSMAYIICPSIISI